jgi:small subunit ribosomal protein S9
MSNTTLAAQHGTRKACVANAYILAGTGKMEVRRSISQRDVLNAKRRGRERNQLKTTYTVDEYFYSVISQRPTEYLNEIIQRVNRHTSLDVIITVRGGGIKTQLQACRLAIAKALVKLEPSCKPLIADECRTDARKKERSKIGCRGKARRKVQFSKR